ncbi:MAG: hypothetical protein AB4058_02415 [Microcystaceae cyanobacterium]
MSKFSFPSDDLPSPEGVDSNLLWELDEMASRCFYLNCHTGVQMLLSRCVWRLTTQGSALTLRILCPSQGINWQVLKKLPIISFHLAHFCPKAQISIYPVPKTDMPWTVKVRDAVGFI